jgi:hypothetical protein
MARTKLFQDSIGRDIKPGHVIAVTRRDRYSGNKVAVVTRFTFNKKRPDEPSRIYFLETSYNGKVYEGYKGMEWGRQDCVVRLPVDDEIRAALSGIVKDAIADGKLPKDYKLGIPLGTEEEVEEDEEIGEATLSGVSLLRS